MADTVHQCDAVVLAAGYGTRLARDIELDPSNAYAHLRSTPKPLLPIGTYHS
jgi:NDP-sugar pyrophosphorylase family protein